MSDKLQPNTDKSESLHSQNNSASIKNDAEQNYHLQQSKLT